jgi:hypothetical protein
MIPVRSSPPQLPRRWCSRLTALLFASLVWDTGCGRGAPAVVARVDTLPGGTIQVSSPGPTGWRDSAHALRLTETLRIQAAEGSPGELVEPGTLAVDAQERIYVADRKPAAIKVFDTTGALVRSIGREGGGPGEFRVAFIAVRGAHLVVHDPMQSRTSVFDTAGKFVRSWNSSCCYWADIGIDAADRAYIPTMVVPDSGQRSRGWAYTRYRMDGTVLDTLYVPNQAAESKEWRFSSGNGRTARAMMIMGVPFAPTMTHSLHPAGGFVRGWSGEYRIIRAPNGEDSTLIMARSWTGEPIPDALRKEQVEQTISNAKATVGEAAARAVARLADIPTTAPAYMSLRVDLDGNTWARRLIGTDSTQTLYDLFSPAGAWLGPVMVPTAVPEWGAQFFGHGAIYSAIEDQDGRPAVVRLSVRK